MEKNSQPTVVKEFSDAATGVAVQVRDHGGGRLHARVGHYAKSGFVPYPKEEKATANGVVTFRRFGMVTGRLLDEATGYIEEKEQDQVDAYIERKQAREFRDIERAQGTQETAKTGKTEREAAKRARHENNLAARRSADQERTSASKSGRATR